MSCVTRENKHTQTLVTVRTGKDGVAQEDGTETWPVLVVRLTHFCTKYHGRTGTTCIMNLCPLSLGFQNTLIVSTSNTKKWGSKGMKIHLKLQCAKTQTLFSY